MSPVLRIAKWLGIVFLITLILGTLLIGVITAPDSPFINYWPWKQKTGIASVSSVETTPTPNDEQAKSLPKVTAPVIPTIETIDTAPDVDWNAKYEIIIRRAKTNELVVIKVQLGIKPEEAVQKYVTEGDEVVGVNMPLGGPLPPPTLTTDSQTTTLAEVNATSTAVPTPFPRQSDLEDHSVPNFPSCPDNYKTIPFPKGGCQVLEVSELPICIENDVHLCRVITQEVTTMGQLGLSLTTLDVITPTDPVTVVTTVFMYGTPVLTSTSFSTAVTGPILIPSSGQ